MNKNEILVKAKRTLGRTQLKVKKHSPEILIVSGIAGVITSAVLACKATLKSKDIIEYKKEEMDHINKAREIAEEDPEVEYTEDDVKKDTTIVYAKTAVKFVKLYAPAIAVGLVSITAILSSHHILRKRNVALAAAYATINKSFKDYRGRVVERFGESLDKELRYNIKAKEVEEIITDDNGNETVVKSTVDISDNPNEYSTYARFFDESCMGWTKDAEYNLMYLRRMQDYANDKLKSRGHLFLNEVYDLLNIPRTSYGQVVGWVYDDKNPVGDNFVDFGIYDGNKEAVRNFVNGYERTILLDFNVDGNVVDLIS